MKAKIPNYIKLLVLVGLVTLVLSMQDLSLIWQYLKLADMSLLLTFGPIYTLSIVIGGLNIFILSRAVGSFSAQGIVGDVILSSPGTYYTPAGIGGMGLVVYFLKKRGMTLEAATTVVFVDKLISLFSYTALCILFFSFLPKLIVDLNVRPWHLGLVGSTIGILAFFFIGRRGNRLRGFIELPTFRDLLKKWPLMLLDLVFTLLSTSLNAWLLLICLAKVGGFPSEPLMFALSTAVFPLLQLIPISISGLGIMEASAIYVWKGFGISSEQVVAAFVFARSLTLLYTFVLAGVVALSRRRLSPLTSQASPQEIE